MSNERDPKNCLSCGTVNPWLNEKCRDCGELLVREVEKETVRPLGDPVSESVGAKGPDGAGLPPISREAESYDPFSRRRPNTDEVSPVARQWNVSLILIGIAMHLSTVFIGEFIIQKYIIAADPEMKVMYQRLVTTTDPNAFDEKEIQAFRTRLFASGTFLWLFLLILVSPLAIGAVVGFFSQGVLDGAAALGFSTVVYCFLQNLILAALVAGPLMAGLGAVGAYGGILVRQRTTG
jgi:ribosomal protein L40E